MAAHAIVGDQQVPFRDLLPRLRSALLLFTFLLLFLFSICCNTPHIADFIPFNTET